MTARRPDYAVPFADLFRDLTPAERRELKASIKEHGVRYPAKVYQSKKHGPSVLDGANRISVCEELGIECPVEDLGVMSDADAKELAEQLNHCRRHLSGDDWRRMATARTERQKRAVQGRKDGKSLRTIAEEEGVSAKTIHKDLEDAGVTPVTPDEPEAEPVKVKGKDGKEYAASKPKPVSPPPPPHPPHPPQPVNQPESKPTVDPVQTATIVLPKPKPVPAVDAWGIEIQEHAAEAFQAVPKFLELLTLLKRVRGDLTDLCESVGGVLLQKRCQWERSGNAAGGRWVLGDLDNAIGVIEDAVPKHTDCPYHFNPHMDDHGTDGARQCPLCLNRRFTGDLKRRQVPPEMLKAMRDHYGVTEGD